MYSEFQLFSHPLPFLLFLHFLLGSFRRRSSVLSYSFYCICDLLTLTKLFAWAWVLLQSVREVVPYEPLSICDETLLDQILCRFCAVSTAIMNL